MRDLSVLRFVRFRPLIKFSLQTVDTEKSLFCFVLAFFRENRMCAYKNYVNFYTTEKLSLSTGSAEERKKKRTRAIKVSYFLILPYKIYIYHTLQSEVVGVRAKFEVEISISFQSDEFFVGEI